jgi:hypothetical protein
VRDVVRFEAEHKIINFVDNDKSSNEIASNFELSHITVVLVPCAVAYSQALYI